MTTETTHTPRERLLRVLEALATAHAELDRVGPMLEEPERGAVLTLRDETSGVIRRAHNVVAFLRSAEP